MKTALTLIAFSAMTFLNTVGAPENAQADSWRNRCGTPGRFYSSGQPGYTSYGYNNSGYKSFYGNSRLNGAVQNGIRNGELSWREVREVRRDERELRRKQAAYYSDGYLSRGERRDLRNERRDLYKDLRHNLRDGERRW